MDDCGVTERSQRRVRDSPRRPRAPRLISTSSNAPCGRSARSVEPYPIGIDLASGPDSVVRVDDPDRRLKSLSK